MSEEYTPGQVSKLLGIPPSTIRRYVTIFHDAFSPSAQRVRGRIFTETDLAIVAKIRDLSGQGIPLTKINDDLTAAVAELPPQPPGELPPATQIAIIQRVTDRVVSLDQRQQEQAAQIESQRQQIDELSRRLHELAEQLDAEDKEPWYRKIFRRKE